MLKQPAGSQYLQTHLREGALLAAGLLCIVAIALGFVLDMLRRPVVPRRGGVGH